MRTEDVLASAEVGTWSWDDNRRLLTLDGTAAGLVGLGAEPITLSEAAIRSRTPVQDYIGLQRVFAMAEAEARIAEAEFRLVTEDGEVLRTLRLRVGIPTRRPDEQEGGGGTVGGPVGTVVRVERNEGAVHGEGQEDGQRMAAEDWDWRRAREAFLLDAGQALSEAHSTTEALRTAASLAMPGFSPDGIAVFTREGDRIWLAEYHGTPLDTAGFGFPLPLTSPYPGAEAMRTGRAVYIATPEEYEEKYPDFWPVVSAYDHESWAYLPLVVAGRIIGVWLVAFSSHVAFTIDDRAMLSTLARLLAQALSRTFLQDTERELTADLQHTMGPGPTPVVPGVLVAARYVPTGGGLQVGGDWYDVIPLPDGGVALVIGDVQGHDVRAAAVMAQLRIAVRAYASEGHRPDAVLSRAARFLSGLENARDDPRFATCLYVQVDPPTGTLDIVRAGHPDPAMIFEDGTLVTRPTAGGLPLGVAQEDDYPTTRLVLQPGETLVLVTDGLVETGHHDLDTGWARLAKAVRGLRGIHLEDLADTLVDTVQGPPSPGQVGVDKNDDRDDMALLLLRRRAAERREDTGEPVRRVVLTVEQDEPARISQGRRQVSELLRDWTDPERVFGAVLMLSEITTNVLKHTDGDALLVAELSGRTGERLLRVEVSDPSDQLPHLRDPGELATTGRGLQLMESLADAWGCQPRGMGKTTWFELREGPASAGS
ncbi:ATP-binding SpoIIE family protein phosphatase [Streptomyces avicenniae]|uniref:ATP-binding SpoIIE family protein phosphatase n=1 Tax=Streptomyces avicenniae TaxID=500153 RepID=UPI00069B1132|nr:SpoIIE family protein phosphatase [Streptomyces avicenniae]